MGPDGCVLSWFGEKVPSKLCDSVMAENEEAVGELEAFAVLVAYKLWHSFLKSRQVVT